VACEGLLLLGGGSSGSHFFMLLGEMLMSGMVCDGMADTGDGGDRVGVPIGDDSALRSAKVLYATTKLGRAFLHV